VPEQFWVDKRQCRYENEQGQIQNPTQADCAQAVSAIKAIAIAQAEGQRIYTIDQSNAATALPKLSVGGTVGQEIRSAIEAGKEVTFHERGINAHGFSGYGYVITDPETGAGAYLIEGKGNGGGLFGYFLLISAIVFLAFFLVWAGGFVLSFLLSQYVRYIGLTFVEAIGAAIVNGMPLAYGVLWAQGIRNGFMGERIVRFVQNYLLYIIQNSNAPMNIRHLAMTILDIL